MKKISKLLLALLFFCLVVNVKAKSYTEEEYKGLNISRGYVICNYVFDLSSYNPTLKDFLLASQSCPTNNVSIYEIKYAKNINGQLVTSYTNLLTGDKLDSFPNIDLKFVEKGSVEGTKKVAFLSFPTVAFGTMLGSPKPAIAAALGVEALGALSGAYNGWNDAKNKENKKLAEEIEVNEPTNLN